MLHEARKRSVMNQTSSVNFAHRRNNNGTTDLICRKCFKTIATMEAKNDFADSEVAHECNGCDFEYLLYPQCEKQPSRLRLLASHQASRG